MSRKPRFKQPEEVKRKIQKSVLAKYERDREIFYSCEVATGKGVFRGTAEGETMEQAELLVRSFFKNIGLEILNLRRLENSPRDSDFTIPPKGSPVYTDRSMWVATGRGEEFDKKIAGK